MSDMKCEKIQYLIDETLTSEEELPLSVQEHLRECPLCRDYLRQGRELLSMVGDMEVASAGVLFMSTLAIRVRERAKAEGRGAGRVLSMKPLLKPRTLLAAATIAGIILVGLAGFYILPYVLSYTQEPEGLDISSLETRDFEGLKPKTEEAPGLVTEEEAPVPTLVHVKPPHTLTAEKEAVSTTLGALSGADIYHAPAEGVVSDELEYTFGRYSREEVPFTEMAVPETDVSPVITFDRDLMDSVSSSGGFFRVSDGDITDFYAVKDPVMPVTARMISGTMLPLVVDEMVVRSGLPYVVTSGTEISGEGTYVTFSSSISPEDAVYLENVLLEEFTNRRNGSSIYVVIGSLSHEERTKVFAILGE